MLLFVVSDVVFVVRVFLMVFGLYDVVACLFLLLFCF